MARMKYLSLWLCLIIFIVFLVQLFSHGFSELFVLNDRANNGEFWRFLTAIFLHGSITHLLYNLFALAFFGLVLEGIIGSRKFLTVFFVSGIIANVIAVNFYDASLGASGAIYGVIGALTVLSPFLLVFAFGLPMPMILASIVWVSGDILRTFGAFGETNIGTIAHLSGIGIGLIFGFMYRRKKVSREQRRVKIDERSLRDWEDRFMREI
jgi:membrane associated rhomboid family serine protease